MDGGHRRGHGHERDAGDGFGLKEQGWGHDSSDEIGPKEQGPEAGQGRGGVSCKLLR